MSADNPIQRAAQTRRATAYHHLQQVIRQLPADLATRTHDAVLSLSEAEHTLGMMWGAHQVWSKLGMPPDPALRLDLPASAPVDEVLRAIQQVGARHGMTFSFDGQRIRLIEPELVTAAEVREAEQHPTLAYLRPRR